MEEQTFNSTIGTKTIKKELWIEVLSFIVPREILQDGFDPETRRILIDLAIASFIMMIILMPNYCFKTKY